MAVPPKRTETVRDVKASRGQCDEIWSFCHAKQKNVANAKAAPEGACDVWTWTALDADTKLIVSYFVDDRSGENAIISVNGLRARLADKVQLTTDGHVLSGSRRRCSAAMWTMRRQSKMYGPPSMLRAATALPNALAS